MYLVAQIWWLLLLAFLLGALVGYLIWRTCTAPMLEEPSAARLAKLERENAALKAGASGAAAERHAPEASAIAAAPSIPSPALHSANGFLAAPRDGKPDNLKLIRGVGPRLEKILNAMGVYHFDQIAAWTPEDLAIVDAHLGDFAGRAVRDKWIEQSRILAERTRVREDAGDVPS